MTIQIILLIVALVFVVAEAMGRGPSWPWGLLIVLVLLLDHAPHGWRLG